MKLNSILDELIGRDIIIRAREGELKITGPKENITQELVDSIKMHKQELLEYLQGMNAEQYLLADIPIAGKRDDYPLSSAQRRVWVQSQWEEASIAYNRSGVYVFEGRLDLGALNDSFHQLIERHEILRTVFRENSLGEVRQVIQAAGDTGFKIEYIDLRKGGEEQETLEAVIRRGYTLPFNLTEGPLLRASLCQIDDKTWILTFAMHHIIGDAWSMAVLLREMLLFYKACMQQEQVPLAPARIQYKDYSVWQQEQVERGALAHHKQYWLKQLSAPLPILDLPADRVRPPVRTYNGGMVERILPVDVAERLKALQFKEGATLFMSLLAAVNVLLYRYCSNEDIVIAFPIAGREHNDLEGQIGFYVNTLIARTRVQGENSFRQLLEQVRRVTLEAYEHQAYPFDELIDNLEMQRDKSRNLLFDVMIVLQDTSGSYGSQPEALEDLTVSGYEGAKYPSSKFDLLFTFAEVETGIRVNMEYNSDLFVQQTVVRIGEHLEQLLNAVLREPDARIDRLEYLSKKEKEELLVGFDGRQSGYRTNVTLTKLIEEQVMRTPDSIAVTTETRNLTYSKLNEGANRLGRYLKERYGVGAGDLVGVKLERSHRLIVAILGILKAGAGYVPMDANYPEERINYMIQDSGCKLVLDEKEMEEFAGVSEEYETSDLAVMHAADQTAYIIYTSGTTGHPKGAMVSHANVVSLLRPEKEMFRFDNRDVWTLFHSICFDFSVWEMYGALVNGGRLVVVPLSTTRDPEAMLELLNREKVTVLNQTPSSFYHLIRQDQERQALTQPLRYVIFGGEALSPGMLAFWKKRYPTTQLINMYGITETTVHVTYKEIGDKEIAMNRSNIGRPLPTLCCYVLDERGELLPVGVEGELYVGGAGVCIGYLNREELTRQRFVNNPFRPGEWMYRSGDRVRRLESGDLEYRGRADWQVKIRGYRIELGEIENALERHQAVERAVVTVRQSAQGEKELVAYVVTQTRLGALQLRTYLGNILPSYMVPAHYVQLDNLPLTVNGKIDREYLLSVEGLVLNDSEQVAPADEHERTLLVIWREILGRTDAGVTDNFFDIGGDSLKMVAMVRQVNKIMGIKVPLVMAYRYSNVRALSEYLFAGEGERKESDSEMRETEIASSVDVMDQTLKLLD